MASDAYAGRAICDVLRAILWTRRRELGLSAGRPPFGYRLAGTAGCRRLVPGELQRAWARKFIDLRRHGFTDSKGLRVERPSWHQLTVFLLWQRAVRHDGRRYVEFTESTIKRWVRGELRLQAAEAGQQDQQPS